MHKSLGWSAFGALLISTFAWAATSSATPDFKLYVGNSRGDDVSIIDMVSLKVIGEIKAGDRVHGVCVQADGKRLFVTVESDRTLRIIDTATNQVTATIPTGSRPTSIAVLPNGRQAYVSNLDGGTLTVLELTG